MLTLPSAQSRLTDEPSIVFTPDDEPYLGLASLVGFDRALVVLVDQQRHIGPWTRAHDLTSLQQAATDLAPSA